MKKGIIFLASIGLLLMGCRTTYSKLLVSPKDQQDGQNPKMCAAIRGNGENVFAHFYALAAITEKKGIMDAVAGGSSASITSFLYDSMLLNPEVKNCEDLDCKKRRLSLLLKSLQGVLTAAAKIPEMAALEELLAGFSSLKKNIIESRNAALEEETPGQDREQAFRIKLRDVLTNSKIKGLVNPDFLELLTSPKSTYHLEKFYDGVTHFGWNADSPSLFFRPGILDFKQLAHKIALLGDFYASDSLSEFVLACEKVHAGKLWSAVGPNLCKRVGAQGWTAQDLLEQKFAHYFFNLKQRTVSPRGESKVGSALPAFISTSVIVGKGAAAIKENMKKYKEGHAPKLEVSYQDVWFGYSGTKLSKEQFSYHDLKSQRYLHLPELSWEEIMSLSPAEPGLASILPVPRANTYSAGGWSDLHPVLVLKTFGCEDVVYVTRRGPESEFAQKVAARLGITGELSRNLFSWDSSDMLKSSFELSVEEAGSVWCTDWDKYKGHQVEELAKDAYHFDSSKLQEGEITGCRIIP